MRPALSCPAGPARAGSPARRRRTAFSARLRHRPAGPTPRSSAADDRASTATASISRLAAASRSSYCFDRALISFIALAAPASPELASFASSFATASGGGAAPVVLAAPPPSGSSVASTLPSSLRGLLVAGLREQRQLPERRLIGRLVRAARNRDNQRQPGEDHGPFSQPAHFNTFLPILLGLVRLLLGVFQDSPDGSCSSEKWPSM